MTALSKFRQTCQLGSWKRQLVHCGHLVSTGHELTEWPTKKMHEAFHGQNILPKRTGLSSLRQRVEQAQPKKYQTMSRGEQN